MYELMTLVAIKRVNKAWRLLVKITFNTIYELRPTK